MDNNIITWREKQSKIIKKMAILRNNNDKMREVLRATNDQLLIDLAERIKGCGTYLSISATADNNVHINNANFCRERLCAICAWRRQSKFIATTYPTLDLLWESQYKMVFITLTLRNVSIIDLEATVSKMLKGWTRLTKTKLFSGVLGSVRTLEVTYNKETKTLHPHLHAILIMPEDYGPTHENYIRYTDLASEWSKSIKSDYIPCVFITLMRNLKKEKGRKCYIETMKYSLKPAILPPEILQGIYYALKGKRLISFSGLLAKLRKAFNDDIPLTDIIPNQNKVIAHTIYSLNATGGLYEIVFQKIAPDGGLYV